MLVQIRASIATEDVHFCLPIIIAVKAHKYLISDLKHTARIKMKLLLMGFVYNPQLQEAGQSAGLINEEIAIAFIQSKVELQYRPLNIMHEHFVDTIDSIKQLSTHLMGHLIDHKSNDNKL